MYWLPLRARGVKRPVSSVNIWLIGMTWMAMAGCWSRGWVMVGWVGFVEHMCCLGCAKCPRSVSSESGQWRAASVYVRPGHVVYAPRLIASNHVCLTGYPAVA